MANGDASERRILQLRAVLRGISPLIWRRLLVPSDTSIALLHDVLQAAFGWEDMHLHRFEIRGREYGLSREGGIFFETDARKVRIGDLKLRRMEWLVGNIRVKSAHSAHNLLDDSAPEESLTCPFEHSGTTRTLISPANLPESTHQSARIHLRWT